LWMPAVPRTAITASASARRRRVFLGGAMAEPYDTNAVILLLK
jgi:hypothetical protein